VLAFKRFVKQSLSFLPQPLDRASAWFLQRFGYATLAYRSFVRAGRPLSIQAGPFQGLDYMGEAVGSALYPKIVGSYELELFGAIEQICQGDFDVLVNIGSAEGYYAVGLARRMPELIVYGFDIESRAAILLQTLARLNGVDDRIHSVSGESCRCQEAHRLLKDSVQPLLICDCEGCEEEWLDPLKSPNLKATTILVELHDCFIPGISQTIKERFRSSHDIQEFCAQPRALEDFKATGFGVLTAEERLSLMDEGRDPEQRWYFMSPKSE
jgi:hypothetical protein